MFNPRYLYNTSAMADKLHHLYRSDWATQDIPELFPNELEELYKGWQNRNDIDYLKRAVIKYIRITDPNMQYCTLPADDTHGGNIRYQSIVKDTLPKWFRKKILDLTVPGLMGKTIEWTKNNQDRSYCQQPYSSFIQKFATPTSEYYQEKFAKDLWKVAPKGWKEKKLETKEEKYEMLELWLKANAKLKRPPTVKDQWVVPKGHKLYKYFVQDFRILPAPGTVWRQFNDADKSISMLMPAIKKGIRPNGWGTFKYQYPQEAEALEKQYPKVLLGFINPHWKENLTDVQQHKVDRWTKFRDLVKSSAHVSMNSWWLKLTKKQRYYVSNHAKMLEANFSLHGKESKLTSFIRPIQQEIKKLRPELVEWYIKKNRKHTLPIRLVAKYELNQLKILKLAEQNKPRPAGAMSYQISALTRSNSVDQKFRKKLLALRPDWFDEKILKRATRKRFHAKKT